MTLPDPSQTPDEALTLPGILDDAVIIRGLIDAMDCCAHQASESLFALIVTIKPLVKRLTDDLERLSDARED